MRFKRQGQWPGAVVVIAPLHVIASRHAQLHNSGSHAPPAPAPEPHHHHHHHHPHSRTHGEPEPGQGGSSVSAPVPVPPPPPLRYIMSSMVCCGPWGGDPRTQRHTCKWGCQVVWTCNSMPQALRPLWGSELNQAPLIKWVGEFTPLPPRPPATTPTPTPTHLGRIQLLLDARVLALLLHEARHVVRQHPRDHEAQVVQPGCGGRWRRWCMSQDMSQHELG